jgi:hypothetical protein
MKVAYRALSECLQVCTAWAFRWRMSFSQDKSQIVEFSHAKTPAVFDRLSLESLRQFQLDGFTMDIVPQYTYLGMTLHQHGLPTPHAQVLRSKLGKVTNFARHILSSRRTAHLAHVLTNATVRGVFSYALPFWKPPVKSFQHMNSCLAAPYRTVLSLPQSTPILALLSEFGTPDARVIQEYLSLHWAIRCVQLPPSHPSHELFLASSQLALPAFNQHKELTMLPSQVVHLLSSGIWGHIPLPSGSTNVLDFLRLPTASKWLDEQFPIRAKQEWARVKVQHRDEGSSGHKFCLQHCTSPGIHYQPYLKYDSPRIASLRARLRLQRAHTNQYRTKCFLPDPDGVAESCANPACLTSRPMETVDHILLHCPRYHSARTTLIAFLRNLYCPLLSLIPLRTSLVLGVLPLRLASVLSSRILSLTASFLAAIRSFRFL